MEIVKSMAWVAWNGVYSVTNHFDYVLCMLFPFEDLTVETYKIKFTLSKSKTPSRHHCIRKVKQSTRDR